MNRTKMAMTISALIVTTILLPATAAGCQIPFLGTAVEASQLSDARVGVLTLTVEADGNIMMPNQQKLTFEIPGTITAVNVKKGDFVKSGDIVARLDDAALRNAVKQQELTANRAEQELKIAEYDLQRANEQLDEAAPRTPLTFTYFTDMPAIRENISLARNAVEEALAALKAGKPGAAEELSRALEKLETAYSATGVSQFLDIGRQARVSDSISTMRQLTYQQERAQAAVTRARTVLDASRLAMAQAQLDLTKASLTAPFSGVVVDVPAKTGDRVSTAVPTTIVQLVDLSTVEMNGQVDEIDIPKVQLGQEAVIKVDALPDLPLKATVKYISPVPTIRSGVVSYRVTLELRQGTTTVLKDGMTGTARIVVEQRNGVLLVPESAVRDVRTKPWVEVLRNGKTERQQVTLGKTDGKNREILSGLQAGERLIPPGV